MTTTHFGDYGRFTLKPNVLDDVREQLSMRGADGDRARDVADLYRSQINEELKGSGIMLVGDDFFGPTEAIGHQHAAIAQAIRRADLDTLIGSFAKGD